MFDKIIEYFYPFSYDADKFVLKHEGTSYSNKYRNVYYSGNGGKSFRRILRAQQPLFTHSDTIFESDWSYDYFTFSIEDESFSNIRKRFDSIEKIEEFMNQEYSIYLRGREEVKQQRKEYRDKIEKNSE